MSDNIRTRERAQQSRLVWHDLLDMVPDIGSIEEEIPSLGGDPVCAERAYQELLKHLSSLGVGPDVRKGSPSLVRQRQADPTRSLGARRAALEHLGPMLPARCEANCWCSRPRMRLYADELAVQGYTPEEFRERIEHLAGTDEIDGVPLEDVEVWVERDGDRLDIVGITEQQLAAAMWQMRPAGVSDETWDALLEGYSADDARTMILQERAKEAARQDAREQHKRRRAGSEIHELPLALTLEEQLAEGETEVRAVIDGLHQDGDSTLIAGSNKVGKTTVALNLVRSLLTGEPFLGTFDVDFPDDAAVLYLNYEVSRSRFLGWCRHLGIESAGGRLLIAHLRGRPFPLDHPAAQEQIVRLVAEKGGADFLIVDTFQRAFSGESENDNTEVARYLDALNELKERAEIPNLLVNDHTGHADKNRARGASTKGGWADSVWNVTRNEATDVRYFSAFGRDIDVERREVRFDPETLSWSLGVVSGAHRAGRDRERLGIADRLVLALRDAGGEVEGSLGVRQMLTGVMETRRQEPAVREAIELGYVERDKTVRPYVVRLTEAGHEHAEGLS